MPFFANAQSHDSLRVSLLTVEPNPKEIYTIFGHTAMRLYDPSQDIDVALNWGMFNSHAPNFTYHFTKGETDYFFAIISYQEFFFEYSWKGATITEQVLDIQNDQKEALIQAVLLNSQPENREYRYNFAFDNCTTRPRDLIEKCCGGKLVYQEQTEKTTLRKLIHTCTDPYPWTAFGIDLLIGSGADSLVMFRQELFLPEKLQDALDHATVITPNGESHPIVLSSEKVIQGEGQKAKGEGSALSPFALCLSPLIIGVVILLIYTVLSFVGYKKKRKFRIPFALYFLVAGLAGCLVFFLFFFSSHPCTGANWNLLWLHPLHLIGFAGFFFKQSYRLFRWFHASNLVLLSALLLFWHWIPQELNPAFIPYILCLGVISIFWLLISKRYNKQ
jgi:hypothetical protein